MIDDDFLELQYLGSLCSKVEDVHVMGAFTEVDDLINHVQTKDVDAVFMDIQMPGIDGIYLAERLVNINPSIRIIFTTSYKEYAVKAFELNALDYIVKPVKQKRLELTFTRLKEQLRDKSYQKFVKPIGVIKNLGMFQIYQNDKRLEVKWRTKRTKELFAYIIQNHENTILKSKIIGMMWDHMSWKQASTQLYSTVYEIRKINKQANLPIKIVSQGELYNISIGESLKIESLQFKHAAQRLLEDKDVKVERYFIEIERYQGDYFASLNYSWVFEERKILKELWLQLISKLLKHLTHYDTYPYYQVYRLKSIVSFDKEAVKIINDKFEYMILSDSR